jgi:hypothetical protein
MVVMSRIRAMSCETAHKKRIGTFVRRNTYKGSVISEPPLNSYLATHQWTIISMTKAIASNTSGVLRHQQPPITWVKVKTTGLISR